MKKGALSDNKPCQVGKEVLVLVYFRDIFLHFMGVISEIEHVFFLNFEPFNWKREIPTSCLKHCLRIPLKFRTSNVLTSTFSRH